jgi:hypothetical protein
MRRRVLEALGLEHRDAVRQRHFLYGGGLQSHAPPGGTIGLAQHQYHLVPGRQQCFKGACGEVRRAGENDFHGNGL